MTRFGLLAVVFATFAVSLTACEPPAVVCGPTSCTGCCTSTGQCVTGLTVNACGIAGTFCTDCTAIGQCVSGGRCEAISIGGGGGSTGGGAGGSGGGVTGGGTGGATGGGTGGGTTGGGTGGGVTGGGTGGGVTGGGTGGTGGGVTGGGTGGGVTGGGGGTAPAGDACTSPIDIVLANGVGAAIGDRNNSADDAAGSCGGQGGGDVVFRFTTTSVGTLTIDVRPNDAQQQVGAYLRTTCDQTATEVPGACVLAASAGGGALLVQRNLTAGTYYLWVDGAGTATGTVNVSLNFTTDSGDVCASPLPLTFSNGEANAAGSTAGATNDGTSTCGGTGADVIYRLDVTALSNFDVTLSPRNLTSQPVVYLRSAACTGTQLGCSLATLAGGSATLRIGSLAVGTYYLWVDGANANAGDYTLTAHLVPPLSGDTCGNARALSFSNGPAGGTASDTGDTTPAFPDAVGSCAAGTGGDLVYTFTTNTALDLRAIATTTSNTFRPAVYVRAATCTGVERACSAATLAGGAAALSVGSLPAGTWFIWVDGAANTSGPYALTATLTAPALGDTCANAEPLAFSGGADGGTAADTGDTSLLFNDSTATCVGGTGGDAIYTFTTNTPLDLRATVTTTSTVSYQPALYLRNATCTGTERACNAATVAGGSASIASGALPAGTYFLLVDGALSTAGAYSLSASLTTPLAGEGCANAKPLVFTGGTATDTGNTTLNFDDVLTSCAPTAAADSVYVFTTTATLDFIATATTTSSTFRPVLSLRNATCTGVERSCNAATIAGGSASVSVQGLPAGTYYLWVDGAAGTSGPFSLTATSATAPAEEVRARAVTNVPAPGPMPVTFEVVDRYGNVMTTDDTTSFTVNVTGAAVFSGATTGAIVSGSGTSSVLVRVTGGVVTLNATDLTQETVTFTAVDSQLNGLRYPGTFFTQTAPQQTTPCQSGTGTFVFTTPATPTGPGTVTVVSRGDLNGGTTEYLDVFMESTGGTLLGSAFVTGAGQCSTVDATANLTASLATLQAALADGTATVAIRGASGISCTLCTAASNFTRVTLTFPMTITGTFQ